MVGRQPWNVRSGRTVRLATSKTATDHRFLSSLIETSDRWQCGTVGVSEGGRGRRPGSRLTPVQGSRNINNRIMAGREQALQCRVRWIVRYWRFSNLRRLVSRPAVKLSSVNRSLRFLRLILLSSWQQIAIRATFSSRKINIHCISKNDTDVAHYDFDAENHCSS